ncbi:MAG TPA: MFS transporter [Mycobacteriales bacterium]|jgi:MFS family permease|nr:MFS transporter [Mycobacteriales bacterium]
MRSFDWRAYAAVLGAAIACYAALGAVLRAVPTYVPTELGAGALAVGLAVGAPAMTGAIARPMGGRWADRLGSRKVVVAGAVIMAAGVVPAFWTSLAALLVSRLLVGCGEALMMSASVLWLLRIAGPEHRGRSLGHIGLANYGGLTIGPLLVTLFDADHHIARLWMLAIVLPLIGAAAALFVGGAPGPSTEHEPAPIWTMVRRTGRPGVGLLLVNIGYVSVLSFGAIVVARHGLKIGALIVPVFGAGVILSRVGLGSLPDRLGAPIVLFGAAVLEAAGLAVFAVSSTTSMAIVALAILSVGQGLAVPALGVLALADVPAAQQGAAAGAFFAWFDGGVGLGGPLVGAVARLLSPQSAIIAAAVAVAAAVPVVLRRRVRLSTQPEPDHPRVSVSSGSR